MKLSHSVSSFLRHSISGLLLAAVVQLASATPVCQSGSLASYVALNSTGGCMFNDLTFFRFAFAPTPVSTGGAALATAMDIYLAPTVDAYGTGFLFTSSYFAIDNPTVPQSATYGIGYSVDPPPIIVGEELFLDPPYGNVLVTQNVCLNDVLVNNCAFGVPLQQSVTPTSPLSVLQYPYPVPFVDIKITISLQSTPGNPAGFDGIQSGTIVAVPEPGSVALAALGVVFGLALRRRSRNG